MADDSTSDSDSTSQANGQKPSSPLDSSREPPQANDRPWWRWPLFLGLTIITAIIAFHLKDLGKFATEPVSMTTRTPQELNFYTTDPNVEVRATLVIFWNHQAPYEVLYLATAEATNAKSFYGDILITSNTPSVPLGEVGIGPEFMPPGVLMPSIPTYTRLDDIRVRNDQSIPQIVGSIFAESVHWSDINRMDTKSTYGVAVAAFKVSSFKSPITADRAGTGTYFAHLPLLSTALGTYQGNPQYLSERVHPYGHEFLDADLIRLPSLNRNVGMKRLKAATEGRPVRRDTTPSDYQTGRNKPGLLFWKPRSIVTTEILKNVTPELDNANDSITPSGNFSGVDYIWQNTGSLEPTIVATRLDSVDTKSNDLFLSGIFFAIAGAALIAFLQELPVPRPPWLRSHKIKPHK